MFLINLNGKDSIYEQIRNQIIKFIENNILKPNDKLPSCRQLASELGINPNTVMKAYSELEANGYIYTVNKKGVYVAKDIKSLKNDMTDQASYMIKHLKEEGLSKTDLEKIIDEVYGGKK